MRYFREVNGKEVFAYDKSQIEMGLSDGKKELSKEELRLVLYPPETESSVRGKRDSLLREVDIVVSNPIRFSELSVEQIEEVKVYRQALLDVPQQRSFPETYTMPEIPSWLS